MPNDDFDDLSRIDADLMSFFNEASWHARYRFQVPDTISVDHPAFRFLSRFGGIRLHPHTKSGLECPTADVHFQPIRFRPESVDQWQPLLGTELIGFGLAANGYEQLWLSTDDRVFASNDIDENFFYVGATFSNATRNLLQGIRHRPLIPLGRTLVHCYGEDYLADDPRVYNWARTDGRWQYDEEGG